MRLKRKVLSLASYVSDVVLHHRHANVVTRSTIDDEVKASSNGDKCSIP